MRVCSSKFGTIAAAGFSVRAILGVQVAFDGKMQLAVT
jgi:hypothetical protein